MRKRILSLLLALTLALSAGVFGVIPALAADSCVSVKADAVTTGEVVAGSLLEIKLSDVFEDTDGHTLTYTLTNAAQFSVQTKVKDGSLYVSEKDPGTYEPKVKATCSAVFCLAFSRVSSMRVGLMVFPAIAISPPWADTYPPCRP